LLDSRTCFPIAFGAGDAGWIEIARSRFWPGDSASGMYRRSVFHSELSSSPHLFPARCILLK
jgi:hypothetical protein